MKTQNIVSCIRENILSYNINHADDLEDYQKSDTNEILKIIYAYFKRPKKITILDVGCSAVEAKYLAGHVKKVVGINISEDSLLVDSCPRNVELFTMDGTQLDFSEKTFDFVYSANLYEHINNLSKCIDEQLRVLNEGGYCYARWEPIWSGPRGHHIHDDMVRCWEKHYKIECTSYKNDGCFIKDWSHLLLSKKEMFEYLMPKLKSSELVNEIVDYIYISKTLTAYSLKR